MFDHARQKYVTMRSALAFPVQQGRATNQDAYEQGATTTRQGRCFDIGYDDGDYLFWHYADSLAKTNNNAL